jgi:hypothetical protein
MCTAVNWFRPEILIRAACGNHSGNLHEEGICSARFIRILNIVTLHPMPAPESLESHSIRRSVLIYVIVWLLLSIGYTLLSEPLVKWLFTGFFDIGIFVYVWMGGLSLISGITLLALAVRIFRVLLARKKAKQRMAEAG